MSFGLPRLRARWFDASLLPERLHRLSLHLQIDGDATTRCGHAGVSDVVADIGACVRHFIAASCLSHPDGHPNSPT